MNRMRVRVYGDSLALPRQGVVANEARYVALLEEWWRSRGTAIELLDRSFGNQTVPKARELWIHDNPYFGDEVGVLILHCGVCDCAPRPLSPWERAFVSRLPDPMRERVVRVVHRFRATLVQARNLRIVPPQKFRRIYRDWLPNAAQHAKRTYVINIAPTNADTERRSPGFGENIRLYNDIIAETVRELGTPSTTLIDIHRVIESSPDSVDAWVLREDGHHITERTHRAIFEQIRDRELSALAAAS
jgi:hypothetical protein